MVIEKMKYKTLWVLIAVTWLLVTVTAQWFWEQEQNDIPRIDIAHDEWLAFLSGTGAFTCSFIASCTNYFYQNLDFANTTGFADLYDNDTTYIGSDTVYIDNVTLNINLTGLFVDVNTTGDITSTDGSDLINFTEHNMNITSNATHVLFDVGDSSWCIGDCS